MNETKRAWSSSVVLPILASLLAVSVTACGSSFSDEAGAGGGGGTPPLPPPVNGTPTTSELTEELGVFVSERGDAAGDGTRARPVSTIAKGIELARAKSKRVYVCEGTYRESVTLENGIPVIGALSCGGVEWKPGGQRSRVVAPASPALRANGVSVKTRIEGLDVSAPDAAEPSGSSIGLVAIASPGLVIVSSRIAAGRGAKGEGGVEGIELTQPGALATGPATPQESCGRANTECPAFAVPRPIAKGGSGACIGAAGHDGEDGGDGGSGGIYVVTDEGPTKVVRYTWRPYNGVATNALTSGIDKSGAKGAEGVDGASAAAGIFANGAFVPGDGRFGSDGQPGKGGKGGAGALPQGITPNESNVGSVYWGNGGAGGGAGGCPGLAGSPGRGGGASVGMLLEGSPISIEATSIEASDGGDGGAGTFGSKPTFGGIAGSSIGTAPACIGEPGGRGGYPGTSGAGAGGPSIAIAHHDGAPVEMGTTKVIGKGGKGVARATKTWAAGFEKLDKTIEASPAGDAVEVLRY